MNNVVVFGAGPVGVAAAYLLLRSHAAMHVTIVDRRPDALLYAAAFLAAGERLHTQELDILSDSAPSIDRCLDTASVAILALGWEVSARLFERSLACRVPVVTADRPEYQAVAELAAHYRREGGRALLAVGLEPGLMEMGARWAAERVGTVDELALQCGGIPRYPAPPLGYRLLFDTSRLPFEMRPTYCVEDNQLVEVPRFSGVEEVDIPGIGRLEAFHDGLIPFLPGRPPFSSARRLTQKTLRWPGYADTVTTLHRLGLLCRDPVLVSGVPMVPEDLVYAVLAPQLRLRDGEVDMVIARAVAHGRKGERPVRAEVRIIDEGREGQTAMARTTGFTTALVALAVMEQSLDIRPGAYWAEEVLHGAAFLRLVESLRQTGITVMLEGGEP